MKLFKKEIIINVLVSIIAIVLSSTLTYYFTKSSEKESRLYQSNKDALQIILKNVWKYNNYFTVDWDKLNNEKHSTTLCEADNNGLDYDPAVAEKHDIPTPCVEFYLIKNAKYDFRQLTTESRLLGSEKIILALNEVEAGFDQVFTNFINEDYYSRSFADNYNMLMPQKFEALENVIREEINK